MSTDFIYYILITYLAGMVRLVSCLLLLLVGLGVNAQTVWNNTYIDNRPAMLFGSVLASDSDYIVTGTTSGTVPTLAKSMLGRISKTGLLSYYKTEIYSNNKAYNSYTNTLIKNYKGELVYSGRVDDDTNSYWFLAFSNVALDSVSFFQYYTPNTYAYNAYKIVELDNCYYVATIFIEQPGYDADMKLFKINSTGNRVWEKRFNQYKRDEASSLVLLSNGHLMLGGCRNNLNNTNERANTWLLEVDTAGQVVRQWFDPNDSTYAAEGLLQTADGGFIYGAQKKFTQSGNTIATTATIVKMAYNFSKEWTFSGGYRSIYTGISDIEQLPDGNFIACGQDAVYAADTALWGWVIKLEANTGSVVWEKRYRGLSFSQTQNFLKDIDVLPDGSFIAAGYCQWIVNPNNNPPQVGWLLKLDADGCEIENCLLGLGPQTPEGGLNSQIQVWPNPFSSVVSIALTGSHVSTATFIITNTTGQVVYQQLETNLASGYTKMLDLSYLPNGVYFVEVSTAAGKAVQRLVKE